MCTTLFYYTCVYIYSLLNSCGYWTLNKYYYYYYYYYSGDIYFLSDCSCSSQKYYFDDCIFHTPDSNLNNLSIFLLYRRQHEDAMSLDVLSMYNQVLLFHHSHIALSFLWDVNDSVVPHGLLVHPLSFVFRTCASTCVLHEPSNSILDIVIHNISFHLSYTNDCPLSVISTDETSNLGIKSESMLSNFCDFDPRKCLLYDPSMFRLIPDYNMSLDSGSIVDALSQLVSKTLGVSWVMPLKQWLSWLKSLGSLINNTCPMLCCQFVFDNG